MQLCWMCQRFDVQAWTREPSAWRGYPLKTLIRNAKGGCPFCGFLMESFSTQAYKHVGVNIAEEVEILRKGRGFSHLLSLEGWERVFSPLWVHMKLHCQESNDYPRALGVQRLSVVIGSDSMEAASSVIDFNVAADIGTPPHTNGDIAGSIMDYTNMMNDEYMQSIKRQLNECIEDKEGHKKCAATLSGCRSLDPRDAPLPTRLVRIFEREDGSVDARLEITAPGQRGSYATLSHRWTRRTEKHRTLQSNLHSGGGIQNGIEGLSRLFRESIRVCHILGIPYIWIDSICIVQDDLDGDWKREAVKMAAYYQNATLTIAATAHSAKKGYFQRRNTADAPPILRLPYYDRYGIQSGQILLQPTEIDKRGKSYYKQVAFGALLSRGWVYQEWSLSRRILCFTHTGPILQCQTMAPRTADGITVAGAGKTPDDWLTELSSHERQENLMNNTFAVKMSMRYNFSTVESTLSCWETIVKTYTATNLTKDSDRMVALAGIAKEFGDALFANQSLHDFGSTEVSVDKYGCGLWLSGLCRALLWEQVRIGWPPHDRNDQFPTWSWASISTKIDWPQVPQRGKIWRLVPGIGTQIQVEDQCRLIEARIVRPKDNPVSVLRQTTWDFQPADQYSPDCAFVILYLEAPLQPVTIHSYFDSKEDVRAMEKIIHRPAPDESTYEGLEWRTVSLRSYPENIVGYASVEHPELQVDGSKSDNSVEVFALLLSTLRGVDGGNVVGNLLPWHDVYNVVYLRKTNVVAGAAVSGDDIYERVGTGRLFGHDVWDGFRDARDTRIRLV
ncbi:uncharacterized protein CTRU02_202575 [Colletotrichum truncatum]|uniref:Uncharacterized protein n=1 Tax=Colletotrichum truncatum TaxID=5467 RepID=A0ACC3ZL23_COLTU|nr:uncharacterized protein CTRU02_01743 [Colletotrichum truncatum]KAF6800064.1 hypothetical protein CTRU02_01743 [Colletotrichum truncatum]